MTRSHNLERLHGLDVARIGRSHLVSEAPAHFWLTRNGHGSGFWNGDWPEDVGDRLTNASHKYGEFNLYVGDDGRVHGYKG